MKIKIMLSEVELVLERISVKFEIMAYVKKTISNIYLSYGMTIHKRIEFETCYCRS